MVSKKMPTLPCGLTSRSLATAASCCQILGLRVRYQEVLGSSGESLHGVLVESHGLLPESKPRAEAGQELVAIIPSNRCRHQMSPGVCPGGPAVSFLSPGQGVLENVCALAEYGTSLRIPSGYRSGYIRALFEESWHSGKMNLFSGWGRCREAVFCHLP